jgi:hypothetical protein
MNRLMMEQHLKSNAKVNRFGLILVAVAIAYIVAVIIFIIVY